MNLSKAKQHHANVGSALQAGNHKLAMHHVGHLMLALKNAGNLGAAVGQSAPSNLGAPPAPTMGTKPKAMSVADTPPAPAVEGPKFPKSSLRSRLSGMKGLK